MPDDQPVVSSFIVQLCIGPPKFKNTVRFWHSSNFACLKATNILKDPSHVQYALLLVNFLVGFWKKFEGF